MYAATGEPQPAPESWRVAFEWTAAEFVARFVAERPEYKLHPEPVIQGATNYVARGYHRDEGVVYKYYSTPERWKNELFCLSHFAPTGVVPDVHESVMDRLTVMSFVPGTMPRRDGIDEKVLSDPARRAHLSHQLGQATGKLVATPLPTDPEGRSPPPGFVPLPWFAWSSNLQEDIEFYVELGRGIGREVPAYSDPIYSESLALLEHEGRTIEGERKVLFHNDFGNLHVAEGEFQSFFDLENCRLGTESMQLSKGLLACQHYGLGRDPFLAGYEEATGSRSTADNHLAMLAMTLLEPLLRITNNGKWSGSDGDKEMAERHATESMDHLREAVLLYREKIDVNRWFTSMAAT